MRVQSFKLVLDGLVDYRQLEFVFGGLTHSQNQGFLVVDEVTFARAPPQIESVGTYEVPRHEGEGLVE